MLEVLTYLKGKQIIHRDLNANNIMLIKNESGFIPMIIDFSIPKKPESPTTAPEVYD